MISVIVSGIVSGLLYAVAGLGLVAVYRTSRVINFAMGGIGAVAAYAASVLLAQGVPYLVVFPVAVVVGALAGLLVELVVARPLRHQPHLTVALGTLGLLLVLQGLLGAYFGYAPRPLELALADAGTLDLGAFSISANQLLILGLAAAATVALMLLISRTTLGLTMRAASSGPQTAALLGIDVSRTRLLSWLISGAYGALAAMLLTPLTYLTPSSFTIFLLTAFAAVVLGGFTSIGGVVIGAVVFGVGINLLQTYLSPELVNVYVFVGIALVLVLRPHGLFGRREHEIPEPHVGTAAPVDTGPADAPTASGRLRGLGWLAGLVLFAALPFVLGSSSVFLLATALATYIGVLGLSIVVGWTGQVSLGQAGFLAVGGITASVAAANGVPVLLTLPMAFLAGAVVGLLIGLPASRLSGIYLVLLTLAFAIAVPELAQSIEATGGPDGLPLNFPAGLTGTVAQYWLILAVAAVVTAVVLAITGTRLGRGWRAVRDSEVGAQALGLRPTAVKLGGFALSSALVALSGALGGLLVGFVTPAGYGVFLSIYALLAVVLGGTGSVLGALLGALFITIVPTLTQGIGIPQDVVFGVVMLAVLLVAPAGISGLLHRAAAALPGRRSRRPEPGEDEPADVASAAVASAEPEPAPADGTGGAPLLELRGVHAGYGQVDVLHGVSLAVRPGEVVALIGANGVGKSTLLRTVSGVVTPTAGEILLRGEPLAHRAGSHRITRQGIGHVPEGRAVFPDLTVRENLRIGAFGRGDRTGVDPDEVLARFPILAERAAQRAGTLSGGQQQILAIGRALMGAPDLLMLDEPSLGLAPVAARQVFDILREIAGSGIGGGIAVLLVEQNVAAALALADRAYVISRGRVVLSGTAEELRGDERIGHTYFALDAS